jgi:hypothetical protein
MSDANTAGGTPVRDRTRLATLAAVAGLGLAACASTDSTLPSYSPSTEVPGSYTHEFDATRDQIMTAAKRAIVSRGYSVADWDPASGTLTTHAIRRRLDPEVADCGTLEGVGNGLASDRTKSRLYVGIVARDGAAAIHATIEAEYRVPGLMDYLALDCVSSGVVEARVAEAIRAQL